MNEENKAPNQQIQAQPLNFWSKVENYLKQEQAALKRDFNNLEKGFDNFASTVDKLAAPKWASQGPLKNIDQNEGRNDNLEVKLTTLPDELNNQTNDAKKEPLQSTHITLNDKNQEKPT